LNNSPKPPAGLRSRGRSFWRAVLQQLEFETHELVLLGECCRTLDRLDALDAAVRASGALLPDGRIAPALVEARQQQLALARLIASLRLPDEYSAEILARGQRRGGARGAYHLKDVSRAPQTA
jgi:hypothetical protein